MSLQGIYVAITSASGTIKNFLTLLALMNAGTQELRKVDISGTCSLRRIFLPRNYKSVPAHATRIIRRSLWM